MDVTSSHRDDGLIVNRHDLAKLKTVGTEEQVRAGTVFVERGHPGSGIYVVVAGTAVVEAPEGVRELGPGSWIGERSMLSPQGTRTARVRARSDLRVITVARTEFERLRAEDPAFVSRLIGAAD